MPPRSVKVETCVAVFVGLLGANVDPDLTIWIFRPIDVISCALAAIALYFVLLLFLDASDDISAALATRRERRLRRRERTARRASRGAVA